MFKGLLKAKSPSQMSLLLVTGESVLQARHYQNTFELGGSEHHHIWDLHSLQCSAQRSTWYCIIPGFPADEILMDVRVSRTWDFHNTLDNYKRRFNTLLIFFSFLGSRCTPSLETAVLKASALAFVPSLGIDSLLWLELQDCPDYVSKRSVSLLYH